MSLTIAVDRSLSPEVLQFILKHRAKESFDLVCELARDCYPDMWGMGFSLRTDPDTEGRQWIVIGFQIPRLLAGTEELRARERTFHSRLVTEVPLYQCPLFALGLTFASV
jgi:hypothetical protein